MKIQNVTNGTLIISDLPGASGDFGLYLPPSVTILIFNEDAEKSVQLGSLIDANAIQVLGDEEPSSGRSQGSANPVFVGSVQFTVTGTPTPGRLLSVVGPGSATWVPNSGAQGSQGGQGSQGPQGSLGQIGSQGAVGNQGPQGDQGVVGPQGIDGLQGYQGVQGTVGSRGPQGYQGDFGLTGLQGAQGGQGSQGGLGLTGAQGSQGAQGVVGGPGPQGNPGNQGLTGAQGMTGSQGVQGQKGFQGDPGTPGVQGTPGIPGVPGAQGDSGAAGPQGPRGFQGDQGGAGPQGGAGAPGTQGSQGALGPQGADGTLTWTKYTLTYGQFSDPSSTKSVSFFSLPAGGILTGVAVIHTQSFTGLPISAYTVSVGIAAGAAKYATAFDVFQAPGDDVGQLSQNLALESRSSPTPILATASSTGGTLDQAATGSVDVWLAWSKTA